MCVLCDYNPGFIYETKCEYCNYRFILQKISIVTISCIICPRCNEILIPPETAHVMNYRTKNTIYTLQCTNHESFYNSQYICITNCHKIKSLHGNINKLELKSCTSVIDISHVKNMNMLVCISCPKLLTISFRNNNLEKLKVKDCPLLYTPYKYGIKKRSFVLNKLLYLKQNKKNILKILLQNTIINIAKIILNFY